MSILIVRTGAAAKSLKFVNIPGSFNAGTPTRFIKLIMVFVLLPEKLSMTPLILLAAQVPNVYLSTDPTDGADHFNKQDTEGYPSWTGNYQFLRKIGAHQFYKSKN